MRDECPSVQDVAPIHSGAAQIVYGNRNWSTGVMGTTASILDINAWEMLSGSASSRFRMSAMLPKYACWARR